MKDLIQKNCPAVTVWEDPETGDTVESRCNKRAIKVDRDRYGKRTCECGYTWFPEKKKVEDLNESL